MRVPIGILDVCGENMNRTEISRKKRNVSIVETTSDIFFRNTPKRQFDNDEKHIPPVNVDVGEPQSGSDLNQLTTEESLRFLRIVAKTLQIKCHYDLFLLMQGEVQFFIPHPIMISAWGDFSKWNLTVDVISAIPRVRTGQLNGCTIDNHCSINNLIKNLHARWVALEQQPLLVSNDRNKYLICPMSNCALNAALQSMGSALVHGIHDQRDRTDSLYVALSPSSNVNRYGQDRFPFLMDTLISLIDAAFRRVAGLKFAHTATDGDSLRDYAGLSVREMDIMGIVSEGRTNLEIAEILNISAFTVKNHVQRILRKLGATNRTEAVAKQYQRNQRVQRMNGSGDNVPEGHLP